MKNLVSILITKRTIEISASSQIMKNLINLIFSHTLFCLKKTITAYKKKKKKTKEKKITKKEG